MVESLAVVLPPPKTKNLAIIKQERVKVKSKCTAPPYGERKNWIPHSQSDFGDGGAYPEVILAQYPQGMGKEKTGKTLALQVDQNGKIRFDAIVRQGHGLNTVLHTDFNQLVRKDVIEDDPTLQKPGQEEIDKTAEETRLALEKIIEHKVSAAQPVRAPEKSSPDKYIRFTPAQQGPGYNSGAQQRIIRMVDAPVDPMEPPKFRHKKIPAGPPSPPPPILHSPPRKVTKEEQAAFNIPPCVSNWKNAKGYTIPLEKRLVDGRGLQEKEISSRFGEFTTIMNRTVKQVAEGMRVRRELENELQRKEKEQRERDLLRRATQARNERAGIVPTEPDDKPAEMKDAEGEAEREALRKERHYERQRERRLKRASLEKQKTVRERDLDRDISEQIALGKPIKTNTTGENMFDARLFNQSKGLTSGFGSEDAYSIYDKPLFNSTSTSIYKPKSVDSDMYGDEDIAKLKKHKFVADKKFLGADESAPPREGPVQFEKEDDDVFGLDALLNDAMTSKKDSGKKESLGRATSMIATTEVTRHHSSLRGSYHKRRELVEFESERKRHRH
ncbi:puff-specific protein Bx42-like [Zophobas morio]|uniref:puff-specific protein Bx42-like n=1 Tax=Zophobas morio TaxID=2755281 RepID=UPI0030829510